MVTVGYFAITYIDEENDYEIIFGNQKAKTQVVMGNNMKIHLLPDNIWGVTLVEINMVTGGRRFMEYYSKKRGILSGFLQEIQVENIDIPKEEEDGNGNGRKKTT